MLPFRAVSLGLALLSPHCASKVPSRSSLRPQAATLGGVGHSPACVKLLDVSSLWRRFKVCPAAAGTQLLSGHSTLWPPWAGSLFVCPTEYLQVSCPMAVRMPNYLPKRLCPLNVPQAHLRVPAPPTARPATAVNTPAWPGLRVSGRRGGCTPFHATTARVGFSGKSPCTPPFSIGLSFLSLI